MKQILKIYLSALFSIIISSYALKAQVSFIINNNGLENYIYTTEQMLDVKVINNSSTPVSGQLKMELFSAAGAKEVVVLANWNNVIIASGFNTLTNIVGNNIPLRYGNGTKSLQFKTLGQLTFGDYAICYQFIPSQANVPVDNFCGEIRVKPYSPPVLATPSNEEIINTITPMLSWIPPMPITTDELSYSIKLVEKRTGQNPTQALSINFPLLQKEGLKETALPYQNERFPLEIGKTYVWQVVAGVNKTEIGKTEIWEFQIGSENNRAKPIPNAVYYGVEDHFSASTQYTLNNNISIAYDNRTYEGNLNYIVYKEGDNESKNIQLAKIELMPGLNHLSIDCGQSVLTKNNKYILEITDANGKKYYHRFTYN